MYILKTTAMLAAKCEEGEIFQQKREGRTFDPWQMDIVR